MQWQPRAVTLTVSPCASGPVTVTKGNEESRGGLVPEAEVAFGSSLAGLDQDYAHSHASLPKCYHVHLHHYSHANVKQAPMLLSGFLWNKRNGGNSPRGRRRCVFPNNRSLFICWWIKWTVQVEWNYSSKSVKRWLQKAVSARFLRDVSLPGC